MGTLDVTAKNAAVAAAAALITHFALFNASDVEISGGTPAYARKAKTGSTAASGGSDDLAETDITFDVPACTVRYIKGMTASSGGSARGTHQLATDEVFTSQSTLTLTSAVISAIDPA
jgi:hypothetical protein